MCDIKTWVVTPGPMDYEVAWIAMLVASYNNPTLISNDSWMCYYLEQKEHGIISAKHRTLLESTFPFLFKSPSDLTFKNVKKVVTKRVPIE